MRRISRSRGSVHPFSHRLTVREETPSAAAVSREVSERSCMALDSQPAKVAPSPSVSSARGGREPDPDLSPWTVTRMSTVRCPDWSARSRSAEETSRSSPGGWLDVRAFEARSRADSAITSASVDRKPSSGHFEGRHRGAGRVVLERWGRYRGNDPFAMDLQFDSRPRSPPPAKGDRPSSPYGPGSAETCSTAPPPGPASSSPTASSTVGSSLTIRSTSGSSSIAGSSTSR